MKVGIVCYPSVGGSGFVASNLGIELACHYDIEVHFIVYDVPFLLQEGRELRPCNLFIHHVDIIDYPLFRRIHPPFTMLEATKIFHVAEKHKLDIIHTHYVIPHALAACVAQELCNHRIKTVTTAHGSDVHTVGVDPAYKPAVKFVLLRSNKLTAVSRWLKINMERDFELKNDTEVIYNFIDTNRFRNINRDDLRLHDGFDHVLIHASNFRPIKRTPFLIKAFAKVVETHPHTRLEMVGDGPERYTAERLVHTLGLDKNVVFEGIRRDMPGLFSGSDLLVAPSELESFNLTLAESMSCETPVVSSHVGGIPEVVLDGKTGILLPVEDDPEPLANTIIQLLEDAPRRNQMGKTGRQHVQKHFSPDSVVPLYVSTYYKLLEQP
ncbi:MAG: N-acetyl-alpha-D-glucosaminyl L-malate synthase BshA [Candidatus Heimdallarchaeota archaeon]